MHDSIQCYASIENENKSLYLLKWEELLDKENYIYVEIQDQYYNPLVDCNGHWIMNCNLGCMKIFLIVDYGIGDNILKGIEPVKKAKVIKCKLANGFKFTGRELSAKLVISKNKDSNGNNITMILKQWKNRFYFVPVADIYLDFNKTMLVMPQYKPIPVLSTLYRDIIPSVKYRNCYIFAPDSDFQPLFKEILSPDGKCIWGVVFDEITLHLYSYYVDSYQDDGDEKEFFVYLSTHQINVRKKEEARKEAKRQREWDRECQRMTDDLFEEAGYDFMD